MAALFLASFAMLQCLLSVQSRGQSDFPSLSDLVPVQPISADVMGLDVSKRGQELAARMQQALASKQQWFMDYTKANAGKGPLPYHENFGLTKEEYEEFLASNKNVGLRKVTQIPVAIVRTEDVVEIRFDQTTNSLQPVSIDVNQGIAKTPLATMTSPEKRDSGKNGGALGQHQSWTWESRTGSIESGSVTSVSLSVGRIAGSGKEFLRYEVFQMVDRQPKIRFETLLFYDLQPVKAEQSRR